MPKSLSPFSITLDGIELACVIDPTQPNGADGFTGAFAAQDSTRHLERRDVPAYIRRFSRGFGLMEMRDDADDGGYAWAEGAMMWGENGPTPAGRMVNKGLGLGLGYSAASIQVTDSVLYDGSVWAICSNGKILKYTVDPSATPVEHPPSGLAFNGGSTGFRAGYVPFAMAVFATAAGVPALYVGCINGGTGQWRMYQYVTATGWTESAVLGFNVLSMGVTWWEGRDGVGALRLLIHAGANVVRHCIYGSDPMLAASYVTPIQIGNPYYALRKILAAPGHAYGVCANGIWDFNEQRCWNLTPTWEETADGRDARIFDDYIVGVRGNDLDRYDLKLSGQQARIPGTCTPGAFMQDGHPIQGTVNLGVQHNGWLLAHVYNPQKNTTYLGRGKDRESLGIDIPAPMVWHFAEQTMPAVSTTRAAQITRMMVVPSSTTGASYLWMWSTVGAEAANFDIDLYYAPLPTAAGPLSFQASGGTFTYNATARIYHTALTAGDRNATKGMRRIDVSGRKVSASRTIQIKSRADGDPLTITDQSTWTDQGTLTTDAGSLTPTSNVSGHSIAIQSILTTPSPYTAAPELHEVSPRFRVVRETFEIRTLYVVLERDYDLIDGQPDIRDPDTTFAAVAALQNRATPVTLIDQYGVSHSVYVEQGVAFTSEVIGGDARTLAKLELSLVA
jgi:hypothetical protein